MFRLCFVVLVLAIAAVVTATTTPSVPCMTVHVTPTQVVLRLRPFSSTDVGTECVCLPATRAVLLGTLNASAVPLPAMPIMWQTLFATNVLGAITGQVVAYPDTGKVIAFLGGQPLTVLPSCATAQFGLPMGVEFTYAHNV